MIFFLICNFGAILGCFQKLGDVAHLQYVGYSSTVQVFSFPGLPVTGCWPDKRSCRNGTDRQTDQQTAGWTERRTDRARFIMPLPPELISGGRQKLHCSNVV